MGPGHLALKNSAKFRDDTFIYRTVVRFRDDDTFVCRFAGHYTILWLFACKNDKNIPLPSKAGDRLGTPW